MPHQVPFPEAPEADGSLPEYFVRTWMALSETMGYYGRSMTNLEGEVWKGLITRYGEQAITNFLRMHISTSTFAPKVDEALKMLDPGRNNARVAYESLSASVASVGPYSVPTFRDLAIPAAVVAMGGWMKVCETMPESDGSFRATKFQERFEAAYAVASADIAMRRQLPVSLRCLHDLARPQDRSLLGLGSGLDANSVAYDEPLLSDDPAYSALAVPERVRE